MVEDDVSLPLSSRVRGEKAEYVEFQVEQGVSKAEVVREGIRALIDQDDSWPPNSGGDDEEGSSTSAETESNDLGMLVPTESGGEVSLNDPDSELFENDDVELNPYSLTGWVRGEALAGQYDDNSSDDKRGRKHVYRAVANYIDSGYGTPRYNLSSAFVEHLGVAEQTAESAIDRLVADGLLYPHPSTKNGVLSDRLMNRVRLFLAGKGGQGEPEDVLTKNEKETYPADWRELLSHFDKFRGNFYYTDRDRYLEELAESLEAGLVAASRTKPSDDIYVDMDQKRVSMTKLEQTLAWKKVLMEYYRVLDGKLPEWDVDEEEFKDIVYGAAHLEENEVGTDKHIGLREDITEIIDKAKAAVDSESAPDIDSDMSVDEAADLLDYDDLDGVFEEDVEEQFNEIAHDLHPDTSEDGNEDMGELGISDDFSDLKEARDVLLEVVDEKPDTDTDVFDDDGDDVDEEAVSEQSVEVDEEEMEELDSRMDQLSAAQAEAADESSSEFGI